MLVSWSGALSAMMIFSGTLRCLRINKRVKDMLQCSQILIDTFELINEMRICYNIGRYCSISYE